MKLFASYRGLFVLAVLGASCGLVQAAPVALEVDLFMNGNWVWGADPEAVRNGDGTYTVADGEYSSAGNAYTLRWWDMEFNTDPFISGNSAVTNNTGVTQTFTLLFTLPIAPPVTPSSLMGGSTGYTVTDANFSGAALLSTVSPGTSLYAGRIDGVDVLPLYPDLTTLAVASAGMSNSMNTSAGLPGPTIPGPAALASIGIKHHFTLSPGDEASFTSFFIVVPEPGTLALLLLGGVLLRRR